MQPVGHKTVVIFLVIFLCSLNCSLAKFLSKIQSSSPLSKFPIILVQYTVLNHEYPWAWESLLFQFPYLIIWQTACNFSIQGWTESTWIWRHQLTHRETGASWLLYICDSLMNSKLTSCWKWTVLNSIDWFLHWSLQHVWAAIVYGV